MGRKHQAIAGLLLIAVWAFPATRLLAQQVYGSIVGTVFDASGAAVPNAKVIITDLDKKVNYTTSTNESGNYGQAHLIIGRYQVRVEVNGFKTAIEDNVNVSVDTVSHVDITLQPGEITQSVDVTAETPLLKTERTDVATTLSEKTVEELPSFGRNFTYYLLLSRDHSVQLVGQLDRKSSKRDCGECQRPAFHRGWVHVGRNRQPGLHVREHDCGARSRFGRSSQDNQCQLRCGVWTGECRSRIDHHQVWQQPVSWQRLYVPAQ